MTVDNVIEWLYSIFCFIWHFRVESLGKNIPKTLLRLLLFSWLWILLKNKYIYYLRLICQLCTLQELRTFSSIFNDWKYIVFLMLYTLSHHCWEESGRISYITSSLTNARQITFLYHFYLNMYISVTNQKQQFIKHLVCHEWGTKWLITLNGVLKQMYTRFQKPTVRFP